MRARAAALPSALRVDRGKAPGLFGNRVGVFYWRNWGEAAAAHQDLVGTAKLRELELSPDQLAKMAESRFNVHHFDQDPEQVADWATSWVSMLICHRLSEVGLGVQGGLGLPIRHIQDGEEIDVFEVVSKRIADEMSHFEWRMFWEGHGLGDVELATGISGVGDNQQSAETTGGATA